MPGCFSSVGVVTNPSTKPDLVSLTWRTLPSESKDAQEHFNQGFKSEGNIIQMDSSFPVKHKVGNVVIFVLPHGEG